MLKPLTLLRLDGLAVLILSLCFYQTQGGAWITFFLCFFLPDLGFIGYLKNAKWGAFTYNLLHNYTLPCFLAVVFIYYKSEWIIYCLIWFAHIGFDHMLGYGLKYETGFKDTHLGKIGA